MQGSATLWTEKYRPEGIENMSLPFDSRNLFNSILGRKAPLPNLLLYGPPGTGKTSAALILSRALSKRESVLEMNASSDREISVIRGKIKTFASTKSHTGGIKIIIMDECEYLTPDAQHCLRRIIEDMHRTTRFIFITNYLNKIIDPIKSRLTQVRLSGLQPAQCEQTLLFIQQKESLNISYEAIKHIVSLCNGDMRKCITLLQTVSKCKAPVEESISIIDDLCSIIDKNIISRALKVCSVEEVMSLADEIAMKGYSALSFAKTISHSLSVLPNKSLGVLSLMRDLSEIEERIVLGGTDYIQVANILGEIAKMNNQMVG